MKKKGLKEATQLYHVSSSPVNDTLLEKSASPTNSSIQTPTSFPHAALPSSSQDGANPNHFRITAPFSEPLAQTPRFVDDRQSPRVEPVLGPSGSRDNTNRHNRTADWVEMVERSGLASQRGTGHPGMRNSYSKNPNFRRTCSFNETKPPLSSQSRQFRERSMTQVT